MKKALLILTVLGLLVSCTENFPYIEPENTVWIVNSTGNVVTFKLNDEEIRDLSPGAYFFRDAEENEIFNIEFYVNYGSEKAFENGYYFIKYNISDIFNKTFTASHFRNLLYIKLVNNVVTTSELKLTREEFYNSNK